MGKLLLATTLGEVLKLDAEPDFAFKNLHSGRSICCKLRDFNAHEEVFLISPFAPFPPPPPPAPAFLPLFPTRYLELLKAIPAAFGQQVEAVFAGQDYCGILTFPKDSFGNALISKLFFEL